MKRVTIITAALLAALATPANAQEPRGSLGLGRMHGYNAGASQSGCGSSWAICKYRTNWRGRYRTPEYQTTQKRLSSKCNRGNAWMDACK
jgi:hypothetical protein